MFNVENMFKKRAKDDMLEGKVATMKDEIEKLEDEFL